MPTALQFSVAEMAERYDAFAEEQQATQSFPEEIGQAVKQGGTTGNALVDLVVMRAGVYVPEVVKNYRPVEEKLRKNAGKSALVAVAEIHQFYRDDWHRWVFDDGHIRLLSGVLSGEAPEIDLDKQSWAIPTIDGYREQSARGTASIFTHDRGYRLSEPQHVEGNMLVDDALDTPDVADHNSALGQPVIQSGTATLGDRESAYGPVRLGTRYIKEVTLAVGGREARALIKEYRKGYAEEFKKMHRQSERFPVLLTELANTK